MTIRTTHRTSRFIWEYLRSGPGKVYYVDNLYVADPEHPSSSYAEDLTLAEACMAGDPQAWEKFISSYRPILYRAADAIDPTGGARDLADELFADLYGLRHKEGERQSLFRYYQGRSRLGTWLRAVLAQRHVDRIRARRRIDPIEENDAFPAAPESEQDPGRARYLSAMQETLAAAVAALDARDRLRLACYYRQDMTLAAIGRMLKEHEATVSRHLARTRREIRDAVEKQLKENFAMDDRSVAECFRSVAGDAGTLDLADVLETGAERKIPVLDRSIG